MFSIKRFFRPRQTQPCIHERSLIEALMQSELEAEAWRRAWAANREHPDSSKEVNREDGLPVDEPKRISKMQLSTLKQEEASIADIELDNG